jgi:hypothetical protein
MAPTISYQETHYIPRGSQSAHLLTSSPPLPVGRPSRRYSFRRTSLAHKRRFHSRQQSVGDSPAVESTSPLNSPSPPYTATLDLRFPVLSSTEMPAIATLASDSHLQQPEAAIRRTTAITAALIAVCILVGLTACAVVGSLAYRRRLLLPRWLQWSRQAEDDLGFVFVEYDESTGDTMAKDSWRTIPLFETSTREFEGGEARAAHARVVDPDPLTAKVEGNTMPSIHSHTLEASRDASLCDSSLTHTRARVGSGELNTIVGANERDLGEALPTQDFNPFTAAHGKMKISNVLSLAMGRGDNLEISTLASPELAAVLALRADAETVDVLAPLKLSNTREADDAIEETESSIADSIASDSAAYVHSTESSGSEEDYELHRVETRSIDFKRGIMVSLGAFSDIGDTEDKKSPLAIYALPRVVISASPSVTSEVMSSHSNRVSGVSEIDLRDFPCPPVIGETLESISTSLISEIEVSLGPIIRGSLGMEGRRACSAPQLTS